jgi:uncharacterized protein (TIGR01777 family)
MRIVVIGGTGSIGRRLVPALLARGDHVSLVTRRPRDARRQCEGLHRGKTGLLEIVPGDCQFPGPWQASINGSDAVVHLAGASVAARRWTSSYRDLIERSRVESTHQVVSAIEDAQLRPPTFVCASATGYYGDTGDEPATERFPAGKGFLADLCVRWEGEARRVEAFGVRVIRARIGIVLDEDGPALQAMLPWFRSGFGAVLGSGRQFMPWIHHRDCIDALLRCIDRRTLLGTVNITAPEPCEQRVFAKALGKAAGRPVLLRVPKLPLRLVYGPIANEAFRSQRAVPKALVDDGMAFAAGSIEQAFDLLLEEESEREARLTGRAATPRWDRSATKAAASLPKPGRPPARPRLLVVSAEGFIADADSRPRPGVREAVRAASSFGCAVVVATERASTAAAWLLADPLLHPVAIVSNGAVLWNEREGATVHLERIEQPTLAAVVLAVRRAAPDVAIVYEGDRWAASDGELPAGLAAIIGALTLRVGTNELPPKPVARLHIVGPPEVVAAARAAVETPFWRERKIALFSHGATRLVVTSPLVDRAVAAQRIARRLGASRNEVMALVGSLDDLGLADWCGFSVATTDAPDAVRRLVGATVGEDSEHRPPAAGDARSDGGNDPLLQAVQRFVRP